MPTNALTRARLRQTGRKLLVKKPHLGIELARGMLRWVRTKMYRGVRWFYRGCRNLLKLSSAP